MGERHDTHAAQGEGKAPWEALVERNVPLVKYMLGKLSKKLPPIVDRDDLFAAGSMGLLEAAQRYDPSRKVPFHSYAIPRIWGAMLDEMRNNDRLSTDMRDQVGKLGECRSQLRNERCLEPTPEDLSKRMGCSVERISKLMMMARVGGQYASVESSMLETEEKALYARRGARIPRGPYEEAEFRDRKSKLAELIEHLPEREKQVILLRYHEGLYLHEIGAVLKVTESRVCQIHARALERLRKALKRAGVGAAG